MLRETCYKEGFGEFEIVIEDIDNPISINDTLLPIRKIFPNATLCGDGQAEWVEVDGKWDRCPICGAELLGAVWNGHDGVVESDDCPNGCGRIAYGEFREGW